MRNLLALALTLFVCANSAKAANVDEFIDTYIAPFSDKIADIIFFPINFFGNEVPAIIFWILFAGIFFTIYFKGISVWGFKHAIEVVSKPAEKTADGCGEVSSFQALATALSGTIGIGSIAGVAISISIGGPGAAFWIFVGALLGMSIKFVEATLAVKYRRFNEDGSVSGGPMHYIAHGLTRRKMRWLGQPLSVIFAILCIGGGITGGNMIQINQTAHQIIFITGKEASFFHNNAWIIGLVAAILIGLVIVGGIKGIAKVTTILTPSMCALYIISGTIVILANFVNIPSAIALIIREAFHPTAVAGGVFGTIIIGLRRSVQSNEAGTGAAAIVYAAAQTKEAVSQGFVALLETFLTGVLCLFTSFAIVFSGVLQNTQIGQISGIELASNAFQSVIPFFPIILSIIAVMFAMSTLISWAYYGQKAWTFLFGEGKKRVLAFNLIYCLFIVIGSAMNVKSIIEITDAMMIAMCIPNVIALYILCPEVKRDLIDYIKRFKVTKIFNEKQKA
ncbi:MAG: alanine:cation symporter family protein [Candidatus Gastranaerophilales bacterium]|nr:alanine:cation symporter family protein [Candidatus Gastranaerophilales bacterium]